MQLCQSDLFTDFPTLRLILPHGGGAVPYHWGRYRGMMQDQGRPPLQESLLHNVFFDTCVYHKRGLELLTDIIPAENVLFASEMIGAVRGSTRKPGTASTTPRRCWTPSTPSATTTGRRSTAAMR